AAHVHGAVHNAKDPFKAGRFTRRFGWYLVAADDNRLWRTGELPQRDDDRVKIRMDSGERFGVADAHIARRGVECPGQSGKRPSALPLLKLRAIVCAAIGPVAWGAELPDVVRLAKPLRQTYLAQRTVTLAIVRVVVDRD